MHAIKISKHAIEVFYDKCSIKLSWAHNYCTKHTCCSTIQVHISFWIINLFSDLINILKFFIHQQSNNSFCVGVNELQIEVIYLCRKIKDKCIKMPMDDLEYANRTETQYTFLFLTSFYFKDEYIYSIIIFFFYLFTKVYWILWKTWTGISYLSLIQ